MKKEVISPGITPIQRENAKTYVPEMTADGWPEFDGFVPDESQIFQSKEKDKAMREGIEEAISASVPEELDDAADSNYDADYLKEAEAIQRYVESTDPDEITIMPDMKLDRYAWKGKGGKEHYQDGSDDAGSFFGTPETSFEERSLPSPRNEYDYYEYEILKPFNVRAGVAAKAYDQPGGGDQYMTLDEQKVNWLIENGYIRVTRFNGKEIDKDESKALPKPETDAPKEDEKETVVRTRDWTFSILTFALTAVFAVGSISVFASLKEGGFFNHLITGITTLVAICVELFLLRKYRLLKNTRNWAIILFGLFCVDLFILPPILNVVFGTIFSIITMVVGVYILWNVIQVAPDTSQVVVETTDEYGRTTTETRTFFTDVDTASSIVEHDLRAQGYSDIKRE